MSPSFGTVQKSGAVNWCWTPARYTIGGTKRALQWYWLNLRAMSGCIFLSQALKCLSELILNSSSRGTKVFRYLLFIDLRERLRDFHNTDPCLLAWLIETLLSPLLDAASSRLYYFFVYTNECRSHVGRHIIKFRSRFCHFVPAELWRPWSWTWSEGIDGLT